LWGEALAKKMFSDQRRLANMMSASLQIRNDANLTEAEKDQALIDLQTRFQNGLQENHDEDTPSE